MIKYFIQISVLFIFTVIYSKPVWSQSTNGRSKSAKPISFSSGNSGVLLDFGVYYGQSEAVANPSVGNEWKDNTSIYDIKLGYIFDEGYYLGAEYSTRSQSTTSTNINATTGNTAAAGLGYISSNGLQLRAYYRINESFGDYKSGTGFQADLGYMVNVSSNFYIGFTVSHRQVTFKENQMIANFDYWTRKDTNPFLTFGFLVK